MEYLLDRARRGVQISESPDPTGEMGGLYWSQDGHKSSKPQAKLTSRLPAAQAKLFSASVHYQLSHG